MRDSRRAVWWRLAPWVMALAPVLACEPGEGPRAIISPEHLTRQIEDLHGLIRAVEAGELLPRDRLLVAVDEQTVRDLAALGLPREEAVAGTRGRFRVRVDAVDVEFRDGHGLVRLDGQVFRTTGPPDDIFAELAVLGRVDHVEVDEESGGLRGRVTLIGLELKRVGLFGESALRRRLLEGLAGLSPQILSLLSDSLVLPVQLEREVRVRGTDQKGPVRIEAARFPLSARVTDLLAFDRRLWIVLDVSAGDWTPLEATEGNGSEGER
ncbi:MAG: hypothetical protein LJF15_12575 [Acidobacteria bacterium]|jgi:hypothetical protein|nr:hypothetical protein [Acidobacteriota bacterium]